MMNRTSLILLWLLVFIGYVQDSLSNSMTLTSIGFIAFNLLLLVTIGISSFLKKDKLIRNFLIIITIFIFSVILISYLVAIVLNVQSFTIGYLIYFLISLGLASLSVTLTFIITRPLFNNSSLFWYKELVITLYIVVFLVTHRLVVPSNTYVPAITYIVSIIIVVFLLLLSNILMNKLYKKSYLNFMSIVIILLIILAFLTFDIQVGFLWGTQIYLFVLLMNNLYRRHKEYIESDKLQKNIDN
jgi:hypothetical protein